jgi:hypothetical protein
VRTSTLLFETYRENLYFSSDLSLYAYIKLKQFKGSQNNSLEEYLLTSQQLISKMETRKQVALKEVDMQQIIDEVTLDEVKEEIETPWHR